MAMITAAIILTLVFYVLLAGEQWCALRQPQPRRRAIGWVLSGVAVVAHAWLLHQWIDVGGAQNLDIFNMISLVLWMIVLLVWMMNLFQPLGPLWLLVVPLAVISIVLRLLFSGYYMTDTRADPDVLIHILLTVLMVGVFCVAGLQAMVLRMQQSMLKSKKECVWFNRLPAIETMERMLYQLLWIGFILLTAVLISSVVAYHSLLLTNAAVIHKALLVGVAWLVFLVILLGRYVLGWRGRRAAIGVLVGMVILLVIYLSS